MKDIQTCHLLGAFQGAAVRKNNMARFLSRHIEIF